MANFFKATPKKSKVPQQLTVTVSRLDQQGCGVAIHDNKPVFIEGALANETVEVKIYEQKSKFSKAKLMRVVKASDARAEVKCRHYFSVVDVTYST